MQLPHGVHLEFAGSAEAQAEARRNLLMNSVVAGLGIIMLLAVVTGSWRNVLLVLANMPFALVGGVLAVFATGGVLTLGSMVGFVTLFGITLRNSIMMISHFEHLVGEEGVAWGPEAAVKGAGDRLAPILMTSIVTALGLLPLALGMNEPGREIEGPMALVIVGGLADLDGAQSPGAADARAALRALSDPVRPLVHAPGGPREPPPRGMKRSAPRFAFPARGCREQRLTKKNTAYSAG